MRKHFLLALPMASIALFAGCASCRTAAPVDECGSCAPAAVYADAEIVNAVVYAAPAAPAPAAAPAAIVHYEGAAVQTAGVETLSAEAYQALLASGKVADPSWNAPGVKSVQSVRAIETVAAAPAPARVEVQVDAGEVPITGDELSTPAIMNAAALREAGLARGAKQSEKEVPHIPSMPLPEGWDYVHEQDLGAVPVNPKYFARTPLAN